MQRTRSKMHRTMRCFAPKCFPQSEQNRSGNSTPKIKLCLFIVYVLWVSLCGRAYRGFIKENDRWGMQWSISHDPYPISDDFCWTSDSVHHFKAADGSGIPSFQTSKCDITPRFFGSSQTKKWKIDMFQCLDKIANDSVCTLKYRNKLKSILISTTNKKLNS